MARLRAICEEVQRRLTAVYQAIGGPQPTYGFGRTEQQVEGSPPRVVFVPLGGPVGAAPARGANGVGEPVPLYGRSLTFEARVWGEDQDATEDLAEHLVAAMHYVGAPAIRPTNEVWDTEGNASFGGACVLTFVVDLPFCAERADFVVVETEAIEGEFVLQQEIGGLVMADDDDDETPQPQGVPVLPAEEWAARKGLLAARVEVAAPFARPGAGRRPLVDNPNHWRWRAASVGWPTGKELTEAEFDAAIEAAGNHVLR